MNLTNDQYVALYTLRQWYSKYTNQIIEISGVRGTGVFDLVQDFLLYTNLDSREIMYLSYNQKQVLELAYMKFHAYHLPNRIYKYTRIVDFDTIPVINTKSPKMDYVWKKEVRKKIYPVYKLMIVFDSSLLDERTVKDLASFGIPIILIRDPMLIPSPNSYTFLRDPNISLRDVSEKYVKSPLVYFTHKIIQGQRLPYGNYDNVSIVNRKQMNLYNLKSSDMNLCISPVTRSEINRIYRSSILKQKDIINVAGERLIVMEDMYRERLINSDESKIRIFFSKGLVGYINRINKHARGTKYVPFEFRPEFYHDSFDDIILDRHALNQVEFPVHQYIPDEVCQMQYAYALTPDLARLSHWDKMTIVLDEVDLDPELSKMMIYTAMTRCRKKLTIIV